MTDSLQQTAPFAALVAAAGSGTRLAAHMPKQFLKLEGLSLLGRVCQLLQKVEQVGALIVICPPGMLEQVSREHIEPLKLAKPVYLVEGGQTRQQSVRNGLKQAATLGYEWVVIHDAARPFASARLFSQVMDEALLHGAALAAWPSSDTVKIQQDGQVRTVPRENVWLAQTPQAFRLDWLEEALAGADTLASDEAQLLEASGKPVKLVAGPRCNFKITTGEDWQMAQSLSALPHIGQGYDVHAFKPGRPLILAGVRMDYHLGLDGHSDADVLTHALMDALLAAAGLGDIGRHFPDSDCQWKNADSLKLLKQVQAMLADYNIVQVSAVLLAEAPKIAPFIPAMQANWAGILGLTPDRINIAATTSEGLGFVGRGEGMAAKALAMLCRK